MSTSARRLGSLLVATGSLHFLIPGPFDAIVPDALPGTRRGWTHISGIAELAVAAAVLNPPTRRVGGIAAAGLFTAVFPANVKMARDWQDKPAPLRFLAVARLSVQAPLVAWALSVARKP